MTLSPCAGTAQPREANRSFTRRRSFLPDLSVPANPTYDLSFILSEREDSRTMKMEINKQVDKQTAHSNCFCLFLCKCSQVEKTMFSLQCAL
jgi:hypothetical protein